MGGEGGGDTQKSLADSILQAAFDFQIESLKSNASHSILCYFEVSVKWVLWDPKSAIHYVQRKTQAKDEIMYVFLE